MYILRRRRLPSPAAFEEAGRLPTRTYCGGPTKDDLLESAGGEVALLDYDDDGRLDIYLVTAAELTLNRERIPHRNTFIATSEAGGSRTSLSGRAWMLEAGATCLAPGISTTTAASTSTSRTGARTSVLKSRRRHVPGRRRGGRGGRPAAGARAAPFSMWMRTRTSISTSHTMSRRPGTRSSAPSGHSSGVVGPASWRDPPGSRPRPTLSLNNTGTGPSRERLRTTAVSHPARAYGLGVVATDLDDNGSDVSTSPMTRTPTSSFPNPATATSRASGSSRGRP